MRCSFQQNGAKVCAWKNNIGPCSLGLFAIGSAFNERGALSARGKNEARTFAWHRLLYTAFKGVLFLGINAENTAQPRTRLLPPF